MGSHHAKLPVPKKRRPRILLRGLAAAGKTTVFYRLKGEVADTTMPTIGDDIKIVEHNQVVFIAFDIGGREKSRLLWPSYYRQSDALVYVVDSADHERLEQARDELMAAMNTEELRDKFVAVLANKQDLPDAYSCDKIADELQLHSLKNHEWCIFPTSATRGEGIYEVLDWLSVQIEWRRTKQAVTEPVVQSVKDAHKTVQDLSDIKSTCWKYTMNTWKSLFRWSKT